MSVPVIIILAAVIVFAIEAWLHKSLLALGLTLFALYFFLAVVKL